MGYLVVLIVDDIDDCSPVLDGWEQAGVTGVTILNSSGLGRIRQAGLRDDLPLMPSLSDLLQGEEVSHRTLLSVVDDEAKVDEMISIAQGIIGDLNNPHTGFMFVVPVLKCYGLGHNRT